MLVSDTVAVTAVVARASNIRSGVRCSRLAKEQILLIGVFGGP